MKTKVFKQCVINGCQCWECGDIQIVKQKNADIYNAYKAVQPKKKGDPITQYSSVKKVLLRIDTHINEETGKEVKTNVMGAKGYLTLEEAMRDCK